MKRLSLLFLIAGMGALGAAPRMVVGELFTNTRCPPCRPAGQVLDRIVAENPEILAVIRYHVWWPGPNDPFWLANQPENRTRTNYYGVQGVPSFFIDGADGGGWGEWEGRIKSRAEVPAPVSIRLWRNYDPATRKGRILIEVKNETRDSIGGRLHCVLTETGIPFKAPNGTPTHNQTMLDMIPNAYGEFIGLPGGEYTVRKEHSFVVEDTIWMWYGGKMPPTPPDTFHLVNPDSCELVVFLQDHPTREIYQGAKIWLVPGVDLKFVRHRVDDSEGNNDRRLNPDEQVDLLVTITNQKGKAHKVRGILRCNDPYVSILDSVGVFGDIGKDEKRENSGDPFTIKISAAAPDSHPVDFSILLTSDDQYFTELEFKDTIYHLPPGIAELPEGILTPHLQVYPSPVNELVMIGYRLSTPAQVDLKVYDATGRCIKVLVSSQMLGPGAYSLIWDGRDGEGRRVAPGVYFCRLRVGPEVLTQKVVITR